MAFGFQPRGLFGRKPMFPGMPGPISGFGGGTFNTDGSQATPVNGYPSDVMQPEAQQPDMQQQAAPKQGLFGKIGGAMGDIGSILDDEPSPGEIENQRQRFISEQSKARALAEQQQAEANRKYARDNWLFEQQWKREHPEPQGPYRWRNNNGDLMELGADGKPRVAYDDPTDKTEWVRVTDPLTGAISIIPQPRGGAQQDAPDVLPPDFDFGGPGATPGNFPAGY